jgi:hypothetical protein
LDGKGGQNPCTTSRKSSRREHAAYWTLETVAEEKAGMVKRYLSERAPRPARRAAQPTFWDAQNRRQAQRSSHVWHLGTGGVCPPLSLQTEPLSCFHLCLYLNDEGALWRPRWVSRAAKDSPGSRTNNSGRAKPSALCSAQPRFENSQSSALSLDRRLLHALRSAERERLFPRLSFQKTGNVSKVETNLLNPPRCVCHNRPGDLGRRAPCCSWS